MSQQQQPRGGRGRGRGGRGSAPSTRGRGSPAPSAASATTGSAGFQRGGGSRGGPPAPSGGRGGGPSAPPTRGSRGGGGFRGGPPGPAQVFAADQPLVQHPRLAELDQLVQSFKRLQANASPEMPLRPGWGQLGKAGLVRTNFFAVTIPPNKVYYEYEIAISPKAQAARIDRRSRIMELVERSPQFAPFVEHVAHDRSQRMVSAQKLPQPLEIPIRYLEEDQADDPNAMSFTVEIKLLGELNTSTLVK